jgi:flagellar biosynthetic protein FliO
MALAALLLVYAVALMAAQNAPTASAQEVPAPPLVQEDAGPEATTTQAERGELDDSFWNEFDRLSGRDAAAPAPVEQAGEDDLASLAGRLAFSLILVVGLAYAGLWGFKRYTVQQGNKVSFAGQLLAVQESRNLGPNQVLHVVRMGEETLLLGATAHNISCLARYGGDQLPEPFSATLQAQMAEPSSQSLVQSPLPVPVQPPQPPSLQESLQRLRQSQQRWQEGRRNG